MENKLMEMEIEIRKAARRCNSIQKYMANDIKVLLKWDFLQNQPALTNICPLSAYYNYHKSLHMEQFQGMIY